MSTVMVFDGNNLAHRCKHTYSLSYRGTDVSILYGVLRVMMSVMSKQNPDVVVVAWDYGIPTYRRDRMPSYKAHRHDDSDRDAEDYHREVFLPQIDELEYVLPLLGVVSVKRPLCEADDILAQASRIFAGNEVTLITTDQDLYQMVRHNVVVWSPVKDIIVDREFVEDLTGADPIWWATYRALTGDASDGIPGINGIGPKTAKKIMEATDGLVSVIYRQAEAYELPVSEKICDRIVDAGIKHFTDVIVVSDLWNDRSGACRAILMAVNRWQPYQAREIMDFLREWNFGSLQDPSFYRTFKSLQDPRAFLADRTGTIFRMPVIAPPRKALDRS